MKADDEGVEEDDPYSDSTPQEELREALDAISQWSAIARQALDEIEEDE